MKAFLAASFAALLAAFLCGACAQGGSPALGSGAGTGSITMYGTVDQGITLRK
jgi:hypothetical protein